MTRDLFGNEVPEARKVNEIVRGYASQPGLGPAGETCRTCTNATLHTIPSGKRFWKCALVTPTGGPGTDIRLKSPACRRWERTP